jgi:type IV pilus assembly protein PilB
MIVEAELLDRKQLEDAIAMQKNTSTKLGEFLIDQGLLNEEALVQLLSVQLRIERYSPDSYPIDDSVTALLLPEVSQKHKAVPLKKTNGVLFAAMLDPTELEALDAIEQAAGCEVEPVICTRRELHLLTDSIYGMSTGLGSILEKIDAIEHTSSSDENPGRGDLEVKSLLDLAEGAPVVRMVNWIIAQAVSEGASDIHISPEKKHVQLRFRVDGRLREVPAPPKSMLLPLISRIKILSNMDISVSRMPQDGRFTTRIENREINIRVSAIPTINGENIVMRLLDMSTTTYTLDNLGMSADDRDRIEALITKPYGMILSTGPTGSGKSTSLYAILRKLNTPNVNIITVEDPVEYRVERIRQLQLNVKAGMTFASGLRSILRQDPDIIMVGEIRDPETARIAVQAALTGHIVLSTVHTNDAAGAITRLLDMGIEPFLVASVLMVTFAQRLLRRLCPQCKTPYEPTEDSAAFWGLAREEDTHFMKANGCYNCMNTGYVGRVGIFEVLVVNEIIQKMIAEKSPTQEIVRVAREKGELKTLKDDAARKVLSGTTSMEEAMSVVTA